MRLEDVTELMKLSAICSVCGNKFIGNDKGTLEIEESTFVRTCKCGWYFRAEETAEGYQVICDTSKKRPPDRPRNLERLYLKKKKTCNDCTAYKEDECLLGFTVHEKKPLVPCPKPQGKRVFKELYLRIWGEKYAGNY